MASAPNSINYSNQLPLGIEAKSQRRLFFPSTGDVYSGDGSSIIRISLNYDGMLDTSQSYLKFDFKNTTAGGGATDLICKDLGQPEISRLVVSSGGVVLEDIQNYNQLVGSILLPAQGNAGTVNEQQHNSNGIAGAIVKTAHEDSTTLGLTNIVYETAQAGNKSTGGVNNVSISTGKTVTVCYKLISGLLDNDKYLPLVLMNNGIDIELHLETGTRACMSKDLTIPATYEIRNVRYVAHLVDLQRDFYDMLRMTQQQSGGVIQIAGQTYRHFSNSMAKETKGEINFNVPVRARSIKSVFFVGAPEVATTNDYNLSSGSSMTLESYQIQIGATKYPPTAINAKSTTNCCEPYFELMKSFGKLGSNIHDNLLSVNNYLRSEDFGRSQGDQPNFCPYGIDLETFRAEIENGIDTSSRALPMTLTLTTASDDDSSDANITVHTYALIDSLFFVNMDGSVSVSA